jgi:sigma-B regulation protein RsbU (phosphoserine phosphatase)
VRESLVELLARSAQELNSSLRLEDVLRRVAERIRPLVDYQLFCIMLWNPDARLLEHSYSTCFGRHVTVEGGLPLGKGVTGTAAERRQPVRVPDVTACPFYVKFRHPEVEIRSELAIPLVVRDRLIGVLDLESTRLDAFSEDHERVLTGLGALVAVALENARLYETVLGQEQRHQRDLAAAREVQKSLLPETAPVVRGISVGTAYLPAAALGGDFYEFVPLGDDRLAVAIGDVSGKGTPAALLASLTVGLIRGRMLEDAAEPAEMLRHLNAQIHRRIAGGRFVALSFGIVDASSRTLRVANAGFTQPLLLRRGAMRRIKICGLPLGLFPDARYDGIELNLEPGDVVALLSDGLQEAIDGENREFGERFLGDVVRALAGLPAPDIALGLLRANTAFAGDREERPDDRAVVVLKVG